MTEANNTNLGGVDAFFAESTEQSRIKTNISTNYFFAWAGIITRKTRSNRVAYIDLYAGPGRYIDGTKSSPLLVLDRAIADPRMRDMLVTVFNDGAPSHTESLEQAIKALPRIDTLKYAPRVITGEVGSHLVASLEKPLVPSFAFIDPYGYKGLSLRLVNAVIKDWACECLFFFNYNRINPGVSNLAIAGHMEALFGPDRLIALRDAVRSCPARERERLVMTAVTEALQELGGRYVLPFRFKMEKVDRTSHYLIFVSKEFLGYEIMREVMAKESSSFPQGVPSFEYDPNVAIAPPLLDAARPLDDLVEALAVDLTGRILTVRQVFEMHSRGKYYIMRNYKDALLRLETDGRVAMDPPAGQRRKIKGKVTLADNVLVRF